ncbi:MAG: hypothetical protein PHI62_02615 [Candidatus Methanomethylophilaceae archaeon]|nr:hypothetical protein [Candidatus Methanomethylophilaceae archaeon]MDD4454411.1 hypothetical protein [Candidatus Methanomethylophilaceae archaeon]
MRPVNGASLRFSSATTYEPKINKRFNQTDAPEKIQKSNVDVEKEVLRLREENTFLKAENKHLADELHTTWMRLEDLHLYISRKDVQTPRSEVERIDAESIRCSLPDGEYDVRVSIDGTKLRVRPKVGGYSTCNGGVLFIPKLDAVSKFREAIGLSHVLLKEGAIEINLEDTTNNSMDVFYRDAGTRIDAAVSASREG